MEEEEGAAAAGGGAGGGRPSLTPSLRPPSATSALPSLMPSGPRPPDLHIFPFRPNQLNASVLTR
ncbi:hypothetical protein INR49_005976 [Caranx melampygus]|nr:hypothetical protein INR49_005976 [Caranx melampygus]